MSHILEHLLDEFAAIQSSGANAKMLNQVQVAGGKHLKMKTFLRDMTIVTKDNSHTLRVVPFDLARLSDVDRAIMSANLGVQTVKSADSVSVIFPVLSQERREELVKLARQKAEEARVKVRLLRQKALKDIKHLSQNEQKAQAKYQQQLTDEHIALIDKALASKEKTILG